MCDTSIEDEISSELFLKSSVCDWNFDDFSVGSQWRDAPFWGMRFRFICSFSFMGIRKKYGTLVKSVALVEEGEPGRMNWAA
jgi:hypothetical protein